MSGRVSAVAALLLAAGGCSVARMPTIVSRPVATPAADPDDALAEARGMFRQREYGLAIAAFRVAIRLAPDNADGFDGLAACYDMLGRFDLSRRYYEIALALAPDNPRIYRNLAGSLRAQGRLGEAETVLAEAAQLPDILTAPPREASRDGAAADGPVVATELAERVSLALDPVMTPVLPDGTSRLLALLNALPSLPAGDDRQGEAARRPPLRILNANGRRGLAARTRARFASTGWGNAVIGNDSPRLHSEMVYPRSMPPAAAEAIRARMPFPIRLRSSGGVQWITLWLGADATAGGVARRDG